MNLAYFFDFFFDFFEFCSQEQVESTVPFESDMEVLRNLLYVIESRLLRNGRTCHNLRNEVEMAREINTKEQFQWIKVRNLFSFESF